MSHPQQRADRRLIATLTLSLCLFVGIACQVGNSSVADRATQPPAVTPPTESQTISAPVAAETATTIAVSPTETQVVPTVAAPDLALTGQFVFIRNANLWIRRNGVETQLTTDAIPAEIPYVSGGAKLWYSNPQLSPDGSKIAYLKNTPTAARTLIVSDSAGKNARQLAADVEWTMPLVRWSNDSQRVYYPVAQGFDAIGVRSVTVATGEEQVHGQFAMMSGCGGASSDAADHLAAGEHIVGVGGGPQVFELAPQNNYLVHTTVCTGSGLGILDLSTGQDRKLDEKARQAVIAPDGQRLAAISDNNVVIYEASSGELEKTIPTSEKPLILLWAADGKTIFYSTVQLAKELNLDDQVALAVLGSSPASYRANLATLWKMTVDTGASEKVSDLEAHAIKPVFATPEKVLVVVVENATALFDYITQYQTQENMAHYYPHVNIVAVDLVTLQSNSVVSQAQESAYSAR
ncbi:hypothetical protein TFLX_04309 [Thermoflexales bacterium]|nr:hypothetical protein TFLX_04309 [Thermoflexales bacterium]